MADGCEIPPSFVSFERVEKCPREEKIERDEAFEYLTVLLERRGLF